MNRICGCCDGSLNELCKLDLKERINGTDNVGMKNILENMKCANLNEDGKKLVEWCVDFLLYHKSTNEIIETKSKVFVCLWYFVVDFLKFEKNSGYDYYLMMYLEWNNICDHGCAIRCAWFNNSEENPYFERELTDERKDEIKKWIEITTTVF